MTVFDGPSSDSVQRTAAIRRDERRTAGVAWGAHALHDGYTDLLYVLLPIWQKEFGIGFAELGLLRALYHGFKPLQKCSALAVGLHRIFLREPAITRECQARHIDIGEGINGDWVPVSACNFVCRVEVSL